MVDHPDDRRDAASLLADEPRAHALELDLARGQRARAELVLEALDAEAGIARLEQEAGQPGGRLGERQEDVAGGIGAEPLVAGQLVAAVAERLGARRVGAHVRAALLLGHRHPGERAVAVGRLRQQRLPLGGELGLLAQRRDHRVGHRHGAHHARVDLAPRVHQRRAHDVRTGLRISPRQRVDLALDRLAQAPVPRRVELDLVDAVAVAVVRAQARLVALGALGVLDRLDAARQLARVAQPVDAPAAALALERLAQRQVGIEDVVGRDRRRLVRGRREWSQRRAW